MSGMHLPSITWRSIRSTILKTLLKMTNNTTGELLAVWAEFWLETVAIIPLGCLGLVGNCIAVLTLRRPTLKTTFHSHIALAICDVLFLIMIIINNMVDQTSLLYVILFPYFWNPVMNILISSQKN